jgi:hypothetical protein
MWQMMWANPYFGPETSSGLDVPRLTKRSSIRSNRSLRYMLLIKFASVMGQQLEPVIRARGAMTAGSSSGALFPAYLRALIFTSTVEKRG